MQLAVPDLVSSSYLPAVVAARTWKPSDTGGELKLVHIFPARAAAEALRDGRVELLAGPAHAVLHTFPNWKGIKILMALSQRTYWLLVARADAPVEPGRPEQLRDLRIAVAPGPDLALRQLLHDWGIDPAERHLQLSPLPTGPLEGESYGVRAAAALKRGTIDAFWANGLAAAIATSQGVGRIVLDPRRGDGPPSAATYTFPALFSTDRVIRADRERVRLAARAVATAQARLRRDPQLARTAVGDLFPEREAALLPELVRRDADFYDPDTSPETIDALNRFATAIGLLHAGEPHEPVVADLGAR